MSEGFAVSMAVAATEASYSVAPDFVYLHVLSNSILSLSYFGIAVGLIVFSRQRRDLPFRVLFPLFGAFLIGCGITHSLESLAFWVPVHQLTDYTSALTAAIAFATALVLYRILPEARRLPSPDELERLNNELDSRVRERTAALTAANLQLTGEIRQRAEAETRANDLNAALEHRLAEQRTLFDLLPVGIGIADSADCTNIRSNRALSEFLSVPPKINVSLSSEKSPVANRFKVMRGDKELKPDELPMQVAARTGKPVLNFEETIVRDDGSSIDVIANAVPLFDTDGRVRGCVGTFLDVTRQKTEAAARLEFERGLRESQKLESLGVLAGGIAHDFNNLLTGILGQASLARLETSVSTENGVLAALEAIEKSSQRAGDLCKQLLAYAGKGRFLLQPLNLSILAEDTNDLLRVSAGGRSSVALDLSRDLPPVMGDATQIRQVLMNLVINASESAPSSGGIITISTSRIHATREYLQGLEFISDPAPGDYVCLEVQDNGCGMSAKTLRRIFDPFFTTKFTGRGLGLSAVLGIVRSHRGGIRVYSELGKGTTFKIILPACASAPAGPNPVDIPAGGLLRGSGNILVIDDEDTVRELCGRILKRIGFSPVLAPDGLVGIDLLRHAREPFAAVLLDLTMPGMDGESTLRAIHAVQPGLPVLLMSGFNEQTTINRFTGQGLAGFLPKPFTIEMLCTRLQTALDKARPAPDA